MALRASLRAASCHRSNSAAAHTALSRTVYPKSRLVTPLGAKFIFEGPEKAAALKSPSCVEAGQPGSHGAARSAAESDVKRHGVGGVSACYGQHSRRRADLGRC
jgi:hypothetical protein